MVISQGSILLLDFDPHIGHEQGGKRPALVVSSDTFNSLGGMVLVCPITSKDKNHPLDIRLDDRTRTKGVVLCRQIRCLDINNRGFSYIEIIPDDILEEIKDIVKGLF